MADAHLLTLKEAAADLKISSRTLREHIELNELEAIRIGQGQKRPRLRIDPADLAAFKLKRKKARPCSTATAPRPRKSGTRNSGSAIVSFADRLAKLRKGPPSE